MNKKKERKKAGEILKDKMDKEDIKQTSLSKKAGLQQSMISRIIKNSDSVGTGNLFKALKAADIEWYIAQNTYA